MPGGPCSAVRNCRSARADLLREASAPGTIRHLEVRFSVRDDGQIDAELAGDWPVLNEALRDGISSLPPRGERGRGPSTYWIDAADRGARVASERDDEQPFLWGNIPQLRVKEGRVLASFDYDEPADDDDAIALADFLALLSSWRERVVASQSRTRFPETYRRNPMSA
jgi:hypothetical protein